MTMYKYNQDDVVLKINHDEKAQHDKKAYDNK